MNELLNKLTGGNLQSDGKANEVADMVINNPDLNKLLIDGLFEPDDLIRGRTAHAIERISRTHPELVRRMLPRLINMAMNDNVPMVKWHMAMIFGNLSYTKGKVDLIVTTLLNMLKDNSVFVKSWALVSLAITGKKYKYTRPRIITKIREYSNEKSISVRTKVAKVLNILQNNETIPSGWIKSREG